MTPGMQMFCTVFAAIVGSGLINILIQHHWEKKSELGAIKDGVQKLNEKVDENAAILSRTHILRFDSEIMNGQKHSKEYFHQQMDDIDTYDNFCKEHPSFKNSYTTLASQHIKEVYSKLVREGEFSEKK